MVRITKDKSLFITADKRSADKYRKELANAVHSEFGTAVYKEKNKVTEILKFAYDWAANKFIETVHAHKSVKFVYYLLANHESSIRLYLRGLSEDLLKSEGIDENLLALNRRILKLALEQTCDVDYSFNDGLPNPLPLSVVRDYSEAVEDLLYLGDRLFAFSEHLAEQRMMEEGIEIDLSQEELIIQRQHHYDAIYPMMDNLFKEGFRTGIMNDNIVKELRGQIKKCMGIDYDFAGQQMFEIKAHHNPKEPAFQTIQPHILVENLVQVLKVDEQEAKRFYDGLTLSRGNKLAIKDSIYFSGSMRRHMFRPILILNVDGEPRALVGESKWRESLTVMATNGFQWQQAPEEWKLNPCFNAYLDLKSNEHDRLLEDEAMVILDRKKLYYEHHVTKLDPLKGPSVSVDHKDCGEMDFIIIDLAAKKIMVTDSKYHRAKYEMVGFSGDFTNFRKEYEPKMDKKIKYIRANIQLVKENFQKHHGLPDIDLSEYTVEGLFIINTPTFYALNGKYPAVTINLLEEFISLEYVYPTAEVKNYPQKGETKIISHPYFTIQ